MTETFDTIRRRVEARRQRFDAAVDRARNAEGLAAWHAAADSARELLLAQRALARQWNGGPETSAYFAAMARLRARRYTVGGGIEREGETFALLIAAVLQLPVEGVVDALDVLRPGDETLLARHGVDLRAAIPEPTTPYLVIARIR